jgi:hypothetical protein
MRTKHRRLARLEKLVAPYLQARSEWLFKAPRYHSIRLGAIVLRGDPKLDEPLEAAWARCLVAFDVLSHIEDKEFGDALALWKPVLENLSGNNEQQKFQHLFDISPPWLLVFTRAFLTAWVLGIKLPDLCGTPRAGHIGFREGRKWPDLPKGILQAGDPLPESTVLTPEEQREVITLFEKPEEEWTRDERHRFDEINAKIE